MDKHTNENISSALKEWLDERERAIELRIAIRANGGQVSLNKSADDANELEEPLLSEVLAYLQGL